MIIIIPTLLKFDISECINSIYNNVDNPVHIHLSIGYNNFAKACNNAFKNININDEWVMFLNDDTVIRNNFIKCMVDTAISLNADIVGAKLIYPNNRLQHVGVYFNNSGMPYHIRINEHNDIIEDTLLHAVTGACMMIKSDVFRKLGGFDDKYVNCFEDVDICLKAIKEKYKIALCGKTDIVHYEKSTREFNIKEFRYNREVLIEKWKKDIECLSTAL